MWTDFSWSGEAQRRRTGDGKERRLSLCRLGAGSHNSSVALQCRSSDQAHPISKLEVKRPCTMESRAQVMEVWFDRLQARAAKDPCSIGRPFYPTPAFGRHGPCPNWAPHYNFFSSFLCKRDHGGFSILIQCYLAADWTVGTVYSPSQGVESWTCSFVSSLIRHCTTSGCFLVWSTVLEPRTQSGIETLSCSQSASLANFSAGSRAHNVLPCKAG